MMLAILFSLKTIESLQNRVATHFQAALLFSMRTESLATSQSCCSITLTLGVNGPLRCSCFSVKNRLAYFTFIFMENVNLDHIENDTVFSRKTKALFLGRLIDAGKIPYLSFSLIFTILHINSDMI